MPKLHKSNRQNLGFQAPDLLLLMPICLLPLTTGKECDLTSVQGFLRLLSRGIDRRHKVEIGHPGESGGGSDEGGSSGGAEKWFGSGCDEKAQQAGFADRLCPFLLFLHLGPALKGSGPSGPHPSPRGAFSFGAQRHDLLGRVKGRHPPTPAPPLPDSFAASSLSPVGSGE